MIRTRFAPSPTGYLHIGGVRTALFNWAFTRRNKGTFVLRIEDTDIERSTQKSVDAIMESLEWIGIDYDEGPFFQTQRFDRYKEVVQELLESGHAYYCYCSKEELEKIREEQEKNNEKPQYPRIWRPEEGKVLPPIPEGVLPVVRFRNPLSGKVCWNDAVKGYIEFSNEELDDLIIARPDGSPTYNFCVVVDDIDMKITHVIRGDDHVNNTPRQINIFKALNAPLPTFAHLPMILNEEGQKLSKRRDAICVSDYADLGILPKALLNYLARLSWGHGNDEVFSMQQFTEWFDLTDVSPSPSRLNKEKLLWINSLYIRESSNDYLLKMMDTRLPTEIKQATNPLPTTVINLLKTRVNELNTLATEMIYFYQRLPISQEDKEKFLPADIQEKMQILLAIFEQSQQWSTESLNGLLKAFCVSEQIKMPQVGMPLRLLVCGTTKTPAIADTLDVIGKEEVIKRMKYSLDEIK